MERMIKRIERFVFSLIRFKDKKSWSNPSLSISLYASISYVMIRLLIWVDF